MPATQTIRILVADDEEMMRRLYRQVLEKASGETHGPYELVVCDQGEAAVAAARRAAEEDKAFAIAFLDIRMPPGRGGLWAAEELRALSAATQIVMVTGYSDIDPETIEQRVPPTDRLLYIQKPFHPFEIRQFASTLAARWRMERRIQEMQQGFERLVEARTAALQKAYAELEYRATHDELTGLPNRTTVIETLSKELNRSGRSGRSVAVVMVDIDHFKGINDAHGHLAGDAVLKATAERMRQLVRPYDTIGRFGGEEFLLVIPECGREDALQIAERLRAGVADQPVTFEDRVLTVTLSVGVAWLDDARQQDIDTLIAAADRALYRAKEAGRNRVRAHVPD
jgi:diguanylate cyclase (GGDEF)-like protein